MTYHSHTIKSLEVMTLPDGRSVVDLAHTQEAGSASARAAVAAAVTSATEASQFAHLAIREWAIANGHDPGTAKINAIAAWMEWAMPQVIGLAAPSALQ